MARVSKDPRPSPYIVLLSHDRAVRVPNGIFGQTKQYPGRLPNNLRKTEGETRAGSPIGAGLGPRLPFMPEPPAANP
jgi:hypothetical protein